MLRIFAFLFIATPFIALAQGRASSAALSPGRSMEWKVPAGVPINVSDGSVVRVSDLGNKLKITARKQGVAQIKVGPNSLTVSVMSEPEHRLFERLSEILVGKRGLEISAEGKEIFIRGRLLRMEDWHSIAGAATGTSARFTFAAEVSADVGARAQEFFKRKLRESRLPDLGISFHEQAVITIPVEPADLKSRVERAIASYGIRTEISASALSLEPLVRVRLIVAEFSKKMKRVLGVQWPASFEAQLLPSLRGSNQLSVTAHALEENGLAKVLASPTLLARSGKEAQFMAGGEFPVKVLNHKVQDINWKKFGVLLKIRPKADFSGRMSIGIETEVSAPDEANKVDGIPGISANRVETHFDLASSRTIVLSGLIKKAVGESSSGLPGLSSLPILGALFSSRDYQDNRTELVIFVTPEVVRPDEDGV